MSILICFIHGKFLKFSNKASIFFESISFENIHALPANIVFIYSKVSSVILNFSFLESAKTKVIALEIPLDVLILLFCETQTIHVVYL